MVYNRCVGTRFCSNNCPYKVRRFNYLDYARDDRRPPMSWQPRRLGPGARRDGEMHLLHPAHPQRADRGRPRARPIRDGEIRTACQQACPTEAIVFGDLNDPDSAVSRRKASPLDYGVLTELNTRPRTTYQASLRNPNPEIGEA